jgi:hypothetical protein
LPSIDILIAFFFGILTVIEAALIGPYKLRVFLRHLSAGVKSSASFFSPLFLGTAVAFRFPFGLIKKVIRVLLVPDILPA